MLVVTDLLGNSELLVGFKGLGRNRKVNGERVLRFLLFPLPQNKHSYDLVKEESTIEFDGDEYRIKTVRRKSKGKTSYKEVIAIHEFFASLIDKHKYETHTGSMTFAAALNFIFDGTGYTFSIVDTFYAQDWENFGDDNRISLSQDVLKRYEAEYDRDGNHLTFRKKIGVDTDVQYRYGHNVKSIAEEVDTSNLSTYIKGYGKDGLEAEYTSPNVSVFGIRDAKPVRDERYTTYDGLMERLQSEIQDTPKLSITIDFVDLRRAGYPYEVANEGDRIFLIYEPMGIDLESRIMEIDEEFNEKFEVTKTDVTLANFKKSITDQFVNFAQTQKQVNSILDGSRKLPYNVLDEAVKRATEALQSAQTELEFDSGIIARDPNNPNQLVVFNSAGVGISVNGGAEFDQAITYLGINTDLLTAGQIHANNIQIIGEDGLFYWDGDGLMAIDQNDPNKYLKLNQNGLDIRKGMIYVEREDGFPTIIGGKLNQSFDIFGSAPYFMVNTQVIGRFFETKNTDSGICQIFTFDRKARYVKLQVALGVELAGRQATFFVTPTSDQNDWLGFAQSTSDVNNPSNHWLTLDLGVPDGSEYAIYAKLKTSHADSSAYARIIRIKQTDFL